ncbi:MAG: glycosyltransferase family 4 protein [Acinetobacter sp.]|uniref:glycosyltransferase family 4 protein n=1 Tax=Acinetobacter sp. TaxID=472 RepID=UPI0026E01848|nr:glycosyltransferase family 4 protein [Acinetobacter sp.]MDO5542829.1 glycosyltransferase family 4 protein [Acinetobacter sp.]
MKILLLSPLPPPVGGIASWTLNILEYYSNKKKQASNIEIIHQNTALKYRVITEINLFSRIFSGVKDGLRNFLFFLYYLVKYKPDVVHLTSSGSFGLFKDVLFGIVARLFGIPFVIHFRFGRIPELCLKKNWEWKLLKKVINLSSSAIVLDIESHSTLSNNHFNNIYIVPNPMPLIVEEKMGKLIDKNKLNKNFFNIIFVGHVIKNKGIFELVKALCHLNNIDELVIVGPFEAEIREELINLSGSKSKKLRFTGTLEKHQVLAEMEKAKMLVLPSYTEGFPNVIIEAMAMRCPIIATNVGAIPDMLNNGSNQPAGLVIEPKSVEALIYAINFMISNPDQAEVFTCNAFLKVKNEYTLEKICDQYENIWKNSVNREL